MIYFNPVPKNHEILKKLYKNLCFTHHPDVGGSDEAMKVINHEYTELLGKLENIRFTDDYKPAIKNTDVKTIKCIFTATRETDRAKLYLLKHNNNEARRWIICWNYDLKNKNWILGTYFSDFKKALSAFKQKCIDYGARVW